MKLKNMAMLLSVGVISLVITGCGGGGSSGGGNPPISTTGKSFYIDSAVSGVNYVCGSEEGITGSDGSFIFENGTSCTFYLGNILLRGVDTGLLIDGENVYETDINIARVLQSLDEDGNLDNGITINASIVQAMEAKGITALPTTSAELDKLIQAIAEAGGTYVSEEDAQNH